MLRTMNALGLFCCIGVTHAEHSVPGPLVCAGDNAAEAAVMIDCTKPMKVVDALQQQVHWLVERRAGQGVEAFCSRPYGEALFLKENNPVALPKIAPRLFNECNQALKAMRK